MIKRILVSYVILCAILVPAAAESQESEDLEKRVSELEQQLEMLRALTQHSGYLTYPVPVRQSNIFAEQTVETQANLFDQMLTKAQLALRQAVEESTPAFTLNGYARSGFSLHNDMYVLEGVGPYLTPAGSIGGSVGRLGLETDTYVELNVANNFTTEKGSWGRFVMSIADGVSSNNDWTSDESGINIRQAYVELGKLSSFHGSAFEDAIFWAGKRFDKNNFDIHFTDNNIVFLAGTGTGFYNAKPVKNWDASASLFVRDFTNAQNDKTLATIVSTNNFIGNWQIMVNLMRAKENSQGNSQRAVRGKNALFSYSLEDFFGVSKGAGKVGFQIGNGLGAELKQLGAQERLTSEAESVRLFAYGLTSVKDNLQFAPSIVAHWGKKTFTKEDDFFWSTVNLRLAQQLTENAIFQYEASYQYMDLRNSEVNENGSFIKFTIAPTLKLSAGDGFFARPELRVFATLMKWDQNLNAVSLFDEPKQTFGATGFYGDKKWLFGAQMEVWY